MGEMEFLVNDGFLVHVYFHESLLLVKWHAP
jgi:hypothetical protein